MSLQSALSIYETLLKTKFDKRNSKPMEEYDLRKGTTHLEGEIRFGDVDKIRFERVYQSLLSFGFVKKKEEYQLKVIHYLTDNLSKILCELTDLSQIQEFCKTNLLPAGTSYLIKQKLEQFKSNIEIQSLKNENLQLRLNLEIQQLKHEKELLEKKM
jgi:hypothetical protein